MIENLWGKFNPQKATPSSILRISSEASQEFVVQGILDNLDSTISDEFLSTHNNIRGKKLNKFERSLETLLDKGFSQSDLIKIDNSCIKKDGSIDETKFRDLLNNISGNSWETNI